AGLVLAAQRRGVRGALPAIENRRKPRITRITRIRTEDKRAADKRRGTQIKTEELCEPGLNSKTWTRSHCLLSLSVLSVLSVVSPVFSVVGRGRHLHGRHRARLLLAPASALLPRRPHRRQPDAVGAPARRQGLLRHGPAPGRGAADALHHQ